MNFRELSGRTGRLALIVLTLLLAAGAVHAQEEATRWTCSMHPQIILPDNSQQCPLCFMDLIPLEETSGVGLDPNELQLSAAAVALAEIETTRAERRPAARQLRLTGRVQADPTRERSVTARFAGRLERLHVAATGLVVERGAVLAEIYSPELIAAQAELQAAAAALATSRGTPLEPSSRAAHDAVVSRLRLWGLQPDEIDRLAASDRADRWPVSAPGTGTVLSLGVAEGDYVQTGSELYHLADLGTVWAVLEAWETDVAWLRAGQQVAFRARALPGDFFEGEILFVEPVLDARTRTVAVRVEVANRDGLLKPGMLLAATVESPLDGAGRPAAASVEGPLLIPASAPLLTGPRAIVYVRRDAEGGPVFSGREVVLGPRAGDAYVVLEGLTAGEEVVTRGAFKIDSALQIQARPSMMNPQGGVAAGGHDHGGTVHETQPALPPTDERADWGDGAALDAYFVLQKALASDDDGGAAAAVADLERALAAVHSRATGEEWPDSAAGLHTAARKVGLADDLETRRVAFQPLSDLLWASLERFGSPAGRTLRKFHCPMAMNDRGADWIQEHETTDNPYFGASMLRCGWETARLGEPATEGK